jgi:hypothetical protein
MDHNSKQAPYDLRILYFNSNSILGKLNLIKAQAVMYRPDIVCITETKICSNFDDNELFGSGYTVVRNDRKQGGGGVLIAFNNNSHITVLHSEKGPGESVITSLNILSRLNINLITYYRPPSEHNLDVLTKLISETDFRYPAVILGDFNLSDITWSSGLGGIRTSSHRNAFHQEALDLFTSANLVQLISEPTHVKGNTLDLVLIDKLLLNDVIVECEVLPGISDHNMILTGMKLQSTRSSRVNVSGARVRYNFKKADYREIKVKFELLEQFFDNSADMSASDRWEAFKSATLESLSNYVPTLLPRPKGKPWMTRPLLRLIRQRDRVFKRGRLYPTQENLTLLQNMKLKVKAEVNRAKSDFIAAHITDQLEGGNSKPLYNLIKASRGQSNNISSLENTPQDQIASGLANFFASVYGSNSSSVPHFEPRDPVPYLMADINVTSSGIDALVRTLDVRKVAGPDNLTSCCLKEFCSRVPKFLSCLTTVLRSSLDGGNVPPDWKVANIRPIFKSGRRDRPENYRPISLTSIPSKLIEHIIVSSMWKHINNNKIIKSSQHGFRKNFSTTTQLLHVLHHASESLSRRLDYHLVSFDFAKAFDKVPHNLLVHKLKAYKFSSQVVNWVEEWLRDRTSVVTINDQVSHQFSVVSGVPQGSVLGPLFFLVYINDMPDTVANADCRLYADDTLIGMDLTHCGPTALQDNVTALYEWTKIWGMRFNPTKCLHMTLGNKLPSFKLNMAGEEIPRSLNIKYLGVTIQSDLKWNIHMLNIVKKSNKTLGMVRRCLFGANSRTSMAAFNTIIRPILEYACQVWSPHTKSATCNLEAIQRRAIRWAYKLKRLDSVTEVMQEYNLVPLGERRDAHDLNFLRRIEFGLYDIELKDYIQFNTAYNTRGGTVNPHFVIDQFKYSFYCRMRDKVKVFFPSSSP